MEQQLCLCGLMAWLIWSSPLLPPSDCPYAVPLWKQQAQVSYTHAGGRMTTKHLTVLVNLPNTCWLLSMAVRRVCSKMASRSKVRAFLPEVNNDNILYQWLLQTTLSVYLKEFKKARLIIDCTYQTQRIPWQMPCLHHHSSCLMLQKRQVNCSSLKLSSKYRMQLSWFLSFLCNLSSYNNNKSFSERLV